MIPIVYQIGGIVTKSSYLGWSAFPTPKGCKSSSC